MEEERKITLTISDLIQRACPFTAASSLTPNRSISTSKAHKISDKNHRQTPFLRTCQNPSPKTLKPLNYAAELIGTLSLPTYASDSSTIKCSCYHFSDETDSVCCDILDFDRRMIGRNIRILAWNFIPSLKFESRGGKGGFLEILSWDFLQPCSEDICFFSGFSSFCLNFGACDSKENPNAKYMIFGVIKWISPVFVLPCATVQSGSQNIIGFLASVFVCECKFCSSKLLVSELKYMCEENDNDHCFTKSAIIYFCGLSSSWHPVISRMIGDVVLVSRLKKKLVYVGKEESQLMYLTTDEVSLHIPKLSENWSFIHNYDTRGNGEYGSYTGIITGVYLQGMVVELDQDVMLLLNDQHLTVPHSLRVGAIVNLKNVHFVDPKFGWGKMLILGACCRTSVNLKSFSPLETGCYWKSHSQSLLQKFIDSLPFSLRLWVLLLISCFRRKFAGILSEKEILGSKHKEGLAQKYASSHLPLSAFHIRHSVLEEFCKHEFCSGGQEVHSQLRLVLPIANLISYCESSWKKILDEWENCSDFYGDVYSRKTVSCGDRFYGQSIRKVLQTEHIGIHVVGTLKISSSSGRLQLVDATGGIDVIFDLPVAWNIDRIFEANDFIIILEGMHEKLVHLDSLLDHSLSCRSIFSNAPLTTRMKLSPYLCHKPRDEDSRIHPRSIFFDCKGSLHMLENGKYHLLMLTHKFPIQQRFRVDQAKMSNTFAQAIILPWDLLVAEKNDNADISGLSLDCLRDSLEKFTRSEICHAHKRCKFDQASIEASHIGPDGAGNGLHGQFTDPCGSYNSYHTENSNCILNYPIEFPCLISIKSVNYLRIGTLRCANACHNLSWGKPHRGKVLLEFCSDSFCVFEALKIGCYYLVKHQEEDMMCTVKEDYLFSPAKAFISSGTHFWSFIFSSIDGLQNSNVFNVYPFRDLRVSCDEVTFKGSQEIKVPFHANSGIECGIKSDVNIFVPFNALNLLENEINKSSDGGPTEPTISFEEESDIHVGGTMIGASKLSSGTASSNYRLPEGNLISLRGLVVAIHDCIHDACPARSTPVLGDGCLPPFLQGNGSVCVHVLVDGHIARVFGDPCRQAYPIGLGRDTYATFHRILVLSGKNRYMMTAVSFVTINYASLVNGECNDELKYNSGTLGLRNVAVSNSSPTAVISDPVSNLAPTALISDLLQSSEFNPMQFCCRVVAVYILVLEKIRNPIVLQSRFPSILSFAEISFAGFVLDDGSSSCCCWSDSERSAMLLGLDSEGYSRETSSTEMTGGSQTGTVLPFSSTVGGLKKILKQHSRVVVKNFGAIFDSSCQDLTFSVDSDELINKSDEYYLRSLIANASFSKIWTVVGSIMDPNTTGLLEERLSKLDMTMPPMPNVWATNVSSTNMLAEARNIIQQLS